MRASIGDHLHLRTESGGAGSPTSCRIVEIHGAEGTPPYRVEFTDGHTALVIPGPDARVEDGEPAPARAATDSPAVGTVRPRRRLHTRTGW